MDNLKRLKGCFTQDFGGWITHSNNKKAQELVSELLATGPHFDWDKFELLEFECLQEILNVLIKYPEADYFWYTSKNGYLFYHIPEEEPSPVPSESLRVDKSKVRALLRDIKIDSILV